MINVDHQHYQTQIVKIADNAVITYAIPPQSQQCAGERSAPVSGVIECRDRSEGGADTSGDLRIGVSKPLRRARR